MFAHIQTWKIKHEDCRFEATLSAFSTLNLPPKTSQTKSPWMESTLIHNGRQNNGFSQICVFRGNQSVVFALQQGEKTPPSNKCPRCNTVLITSMAAFSRLQPRHLRVSPSGAHNPTEFKNRHSTSYILGSVPPTKVRCLTAFITTSISFSFSTGLTRYSITPSFMNSTASLTSG